MVGGGEEAAQVGVVAAPHQLLAVVGHEGPQHLPLLGREVDLDATVAAPDRRLGAEDHTPPYLSCCIVAHKPCSWRRKTSTSAFSLGPLETTALPLWCTSSISFVAFSLL